MTNHELEIIMRLKDEVSKKLQGIEGGLRKFSNTTKQLGLEMRKTGREMASVGSFMAMAGTAITAPLIAAYKEAGKYNAEISAQLNETKNVFQNLSVSIGKALLPVMRQLTDEIAKMVSWWNNLGEVTQQKIVTNIFNIGKALVILGTAFVVVGKSLSALGNLAILTSALLKLNPAVWVAAAGFALLALAMWKCKAAGDAVLNTFQGLANISFFGAAVSAMTGKKYGEAFGKTGTWAKGFDDIKKELTDFSSFYKDFLSSIAGGNWQDQKNPQGGFLSGFKLGLQDSIDALSSWRDTGIQAATDLATGMQSNFKTLFVDALHGQLKSAAEYFADFGNTILDIFADVCSKIISQWVETMIITGLGKLVGTGLSAFQTTGIQSDVTSINNQIYGAGASSYSSGGGFGGGGGGGFAEGGWVGLNGPERVLVGEREPELIVPNSKLSRNVGAGGMQVHYHSTVVIKAWDFADIYSNKKVIENIINESLRRQGTISKSIKKYS